jgi:tetratricopeptide (TPR) repeat protein
MQSDRLPYGKARVQHPGDGPRDPTAALPLLRCPPAVRRGPYRASSRSQRKHQIDGYVPQVTFANSILPAARDAFLDALIARERRTPPGFAVAETLYGHVEQGDEDYWLGQARLAEVMTLRVMHGVVAPTSSLVEAERIGQRVAENRPHLWESHIAAGAARLCLRQSGAEAAFAAARRFAPMAARLHAWYIYFLAARGELLDAIHYLEEAAYSIEGVNPLILRNLALMLALNGDLERARAVLEKLIGRPESSSAHALTRVYLGMVLEALNEPGPALEQIQFARGLQGGDYVARGMSVLALAKSGRRTEAVNEFEALKAGRSRYEIRPAEASYVGPANLAIACVGLEDEAGAVEWLEKSLAEHEPFSLLLANWPMLKPVHSHPRFQRLLEAGAQQSSGF